MQLEEALHRQHLPLLVIIFLEGLHLHRQLLLVRLQTIVTMSHQVELLVVTTVLVMMEKLVVEQEHNIYQQTVFYMLTTMETVPLK